MASYRRELFDAKFKKLADIAVDRRSEANIAHGTISDLERKINEMRRIHRQANAGIRNRLVLNAEEPSSRESKGRNNLESRGVTDIIWMSNSIWDACLKLMHKAIAFATPKSSDRL